ncbi:MAG: hypothetical protein ABJP45_07230 [Cyclobacteriaceae bacterium]
MKLSITAFLILLMVCCEQKAQQSKTPASYTSTSELKEPIVFGQGRVTTANGISFSKGGDTLYTSESLEKQFENGRLYAGIFESRFEAGKWTTPKRVEFSINIDAYHPVLSTDNDVLFFNSRSHLDSANKSIPHNIWATQKTAKGWGTPKMVEGVNSLGYDSYPSVARNNNLYFNSDREGGKGGMDFYVSYFVEGKYQKPINLEKLNSSDVENDLVVDPDERFIIFNRYIIDTKEIDLFISFKKDDGWTTPRKLENLNSTDAWELTPSLSPDGKYFFYELEQKIMQVDLSSLIYAYELAGVGKR